MFYTYVIRNKTTGKIYIGQSDNPNKRLLKFNRILPLKKTSYTYKNKGVWEIVYKEIFHTRKEAIKREKELKSFRGREFIKKNLKGP